METKILGKLQQNICNRCMFLFLKILYVALKYYLLSRMNMCCAYVLVVGINLNILALPQKYTHISFVNVIHWCT